MMSSTIPRHHPLVTQIVDFFKEQNSLSSTKFLKLKNNLECSQVKSSKKQQDFDFSIEITHQEYLNNDIEFKSYFEKLTHIIATRYDSSIEVEIESDSESSDNMIEIKSDKFKSKYKNPINKFENIDFLKLDLNKKRKAVTKIKNSKKQKPSKEDKALEQKRDLIISRMIKLVPKEHKEDSTSWLNDINIDLVLENFQKIYKTSNIKIITLANQISECSNFNAQSYTFESIDNLIFVLNVNKNHWVTLTNIDTTPNNTFFKQNKAVFMYDSLNNPLYLNGLKAFLSEMYPVLSEYVIHHVKMSYPQVSTNDCGLFALAYVYSLCNSQEPSLLFYDQDSMRSNYNKWIESDFNSDYEVKTKFNFSDDFSRDAIAYTVKF